MLSQWFWITGRESRLPLVGVALLMLIALVAAACGGDDPAPPAETAEQPAADVSASAEVAAVEEEEEVVLTIAVPAMPLGVDKDYSFGNFQTFESIGNCYEAGFNFAKIDYPYDTPPEGQGLQYPDHAGEREPWQLLSAELAADGQSVVLNIRPGVISAAGNELTADDVVWSLERAFALEGVGFFYVTLLNLDPEEPATVINDYTVRVNALNPNGLLGRIWDDLYFPFMDSTDAIAHATEEDPWATEYSTTNCAGFGAYTIETWTPGQEVVWVPNPNYWGPEPQIDRVIYRVIPDAAVRLAALQRGEIDIAQNLSPDQQVQAGESDGVRAIGVRSDFILFLYTNPEIFEPFGDVRVRQAINYVMPRREIAESVYLGQATPWRAAAATIFPGTNEEFWPYGDEPDFETARALMAEAGYADGFDIPLSYTSAFPLWEQVANLVARNLAEININVALDPLPDGDFAAQSFERTTIPFGLWLDAPGGSDPVYNLFIYYYDRNVIGNFSLIEDPEVTAILDEAIKAQTLEDRIAAVQPAHQRVLENAVFTFLVEPHYTIAIRDNIEGFVWYAWQNFYFRELRKN